MENSTPKAILVSSAGGTVGFLKLSPELFHRVDSTNVHANLTFHLKPCISPVILAQPQLAHHPTSLNARTPTKQLHWNPAGTSDGTLETGKAEIGMYSRLVQP